MIDRTMKRGVDASTVLREFLGDTGMTQEEFARAAGVTIATANRWINGKVVVSERKLSRALADAGARPDDYGVHALAAPSPSTGEVSAQLLQRLDAIDRKLDEVLARLHDLEHQR
jgi:transcriptional regulator with XRE-family HTH domain